MPLLPGRALRAAEKQVRKGRLDQAVYEYERILEKNPKDTSTLNRLGDLYLRLARLDDAIDRFRQSAKLFADDGFLVKAIAIYKKILRLDPSRLSVYEDLAELYRRQGLRTDALAQYEILAGLLRRRDDAPAAIDVHLRVLELDPEHVDARAKLIDLLELEGRHDEAAAHSLELGRRLVERDQPDEAREVLSRARAFAEEDDEFVRSAEQILASGGEAVALPDLPDSAAGEAPSPAAPPSAIDDLPVRQEEQSMEEVVAGIKASVSDALEPKQIETHYSLGIAYRDMGLLDEAIAELQIAAGDRRFFIECCGLLGSCLRQKGVPESALGWYARALAAPDLTEKQALGLRYELGETYLELGERSAALDAFRQVHERDPHFRDVAARLAELE